MRILPIFLSSLLACSLGLRTSQAAQDVPARITYYTLRGVMANGEYVHYGAAACSYDLALGTRVQMSDGSVYICKDRGYLYCWRYWCPQGVTTWVDIWMPDDAAGYILVEGIYGTWDWITITD